MTKEQDRVPGTIPDRLCAWDGPFFVKDHPMVRISLDGIEYTGRVVEYCISEGWARVLMPPKDGEVARGGASLKHRRRVKVVVWFATDPIPEGALIDQNDLAMGTA